MRTFTVHHNCTLTNASHKLNAGNTCSIEISDKICRRYYILNENMNVKFSFLYSYAYFILSDYFMNLKTCDYLRLLYLIKPDIL